MIGRDWKNMNTVLECAEILSEPITLREEVVGRGHIVYKITKTNAVIESLPVCVYGIEIISTLFSETEVCSINDISTKFEVVNELFELVVQNMVLPCTLQDIAYDFLVSKY